MAELNLFIGNKGGGKTTLACYLAQYAHQTSPNVPIVTNTPIFFANIPEGRKRKLSEDLEEGKEIDVPHAILRRSSLKWLAVKTILKDTRYALMFPDEASLAEDLASRGSHAYSTAPRTWLIALSRKINVELDMLTQMMSMIDKRAQWLGDFYWLCIGNYIPETAPPMPESFSYQIFDRDLKKINAFDISGEDATRWLFPRFITEDVPLSDARIRQFIDFFEIEDEDKKEFALDMIRARKEYAELQRSDFILEETRKFVKRTDVKQEDVQDYKRDMGIRP